MVEILKGTGTQVIASDPTGTMIRQFQRVLPFIEVLQCSAENIALPDSSVDAVVAAHCFHWFANEEAVRDIYRVLVPGGSLGMIWIFPDESVPWVKELLAFFRPLENGFKHTTSKETMNRIFQVVGKLFTVQKDSTTRKHWQLTYDECYNTLTSKGILQSSPDEVKDEFKFWFHNVMRKHFPDIKENERIPCPSVTLICWCKKKETIENLE
ncbi:uncharacterized methyltransferase C25B8.09-like [Stylophora pistillata]|nr:uncharacterized methyltransferase C25B8.09-like [Stylophora pistillata]